MANDGPVAERVTLEEIFSEAVTERLKEHDTAAEIGAHIEGRVLDLISPVIGHNFQVLDLVTDALHLVDWGTVTERVIHKSKGIDPWKV